MGRQLVIDCGARSVRNAGVGLQRIDIRLDIAQSEWMIFGAGR